LKSKGSKIKSWLIDILSFTIGGMLLALAVQYFAAPNNISTGGMSGLAIMINYLTGGWLKVGTLFILLNIPLLISSWFVLGKEFFIKTLLGTGISSLFMDIFEWINMPTYSGEMFVAALFCGVIGGTGIGLVFLRGGTTGGTDVAGRLIKVKLPYMEIGKIMLMIEAVLLVLTTVVYRNINNALYSLVTIYTLSTMVDTILYGIDNGKTLIIISNISQQICHRIMHEAQRGATILKGKGAYTNEDKDILLIAVRRHEMARVKEIVKDEDPNAFIIVCDTSETIGLGFKSINDYK